MSRPRSCRGADPAPLILPGCDVPVFVGCPVVVFYRDEWMDGVVTAIGGLQSSGTVRVRCVVARDETLVNRSDVPSRLRHSPSTLTSVRRLGQLRAASQTLSSAAVSEEYRRRLSAALSDARERYPSARRRFFTEWRRARPGRISSNTFLAVDLCSGPFKSVSLSANLNLSSAVSVSVDIEAAFTPDVVSDIRLWDMWGFLLANCLSSEAGRVHLFLHVHASPPCKCAAARPASPPLRPARVPHRVPTLLRRVASAGTTYVMLNNDCSRRSGANPVAGDHSRPAARIADDIVRTLAFLVRQCARHCLPVTWSIENPEASQLWNLPVMKSLFDDGLLVAVHVDYCMYGNSAEKPTIIAVSPLIAATRGTWAWRCRRREGNCGAFRRASPKSSAKHGGPLSHSLLHSAIPSILCGLLNCAWRRLHSPSRVNDTKYGTITVDHARRLQLEWRNFVVQDGQTDVDAGQCGAASSRACAVAASPASSTGHDECCGRKSTCHRTGAQPVATAQPIISSSGAAAPPSDRAAVDRADGPACRREVATHSRAACAPPSGLSRRAAKRPRRRRRKCSHCGSSGQLFGSARPLCSSCDFQLSQLGPQHAANFTVTDRPFTPPAAAPQPHPGCKVRSVSVTTRTGTTSYDVVPPALMTADELANYEVGLGGRSDEGEALELPPSPPLKEAPVATAAAIALPGSMVVSPRWQDFSNPDAFASLLQDCARPMGTRHLSP